MLCPTQNTLLTTTHITGRLRASGLTVTHRDASNRAPSRGHPGHAAPMTSPSPWAQARGGARGAPQRHPRGHPLQAIHQVLDLGSSFPLAGGACRPPWRTRHTSRPPSPSASVQPARPWGFTRVGLVGPKCEAVSSRKKCEAKCEAVSSLVLELCFHCFTRTVKPITLRMEAESV